MARNTIHEQGCSRELLSQFLTVRTFNDKEICELQDKSLSVNVKINDNEKSYPILYEAKVAGKARLLGIVIEPDECSDQRKNLIIFCRYAADGLHSQANISQLKSESKVIDVDLPGENRLSLQESKLTLN